MSRLWKSSQQVRRLFILTGLFLLTACSPNSPQDDAPFEVVKHRILDQFDGKHLGNVVYRSTPDGGEFISWGRLPLQKWPYGSSDQTQIVPETEEYPYTEEGTLSDGEYRYTNGGTVLDVDRDGAQEVVVGRGQGEGIAESKLYWFDEPSNDPHWTGHYIADTGEGNWVAPHDVEAFTVAQSSGEDVRGVVGNIDRQDVFFLEIPEDPTRPWIRHQVGAFPSGDQSGMEIVDVNGDGRKDIVSGMYWIETPPNPRQDGWSFHRYGTWDQHNEGWGGMNKHGVADFDGDGEVEIVAAEAEIPGARLGLFDRESDDGTGRWTETRIEGNLYAPHSLVVGDLNEDGRPDFIVGEMTAGGWDFPINPTPKIYGYVNRGDQFERYTISAGWGVHEMGIVPERRNGNLVVYAADEIQPQKFDGMQTPVHVWTISSRNASE